MKSFIIDNRRYDKQTYSVDCSDCAQCSKVDFFKDEFGQPYYFHVLTTTSTAVIFCSSACSSIWALANKERIWDRK